jgi:hypothetical protein
MATTTDDGMEGRRTMTMFHTILLVVDEAEEANAAAFVAGLPGADNHSVQIFHPTPGGGGIHRAKDHRLALAIAEQARTVAADLIVLGVERRRAGRHHLAGSLREQLAELTHLPVLIPPTWATQASVPAVSSERLTHV